MGGHPVSKQHHVEVPLQCRSKSGGCLGREGPTPNVGRLDGWGLGAAKIDRRLGVCCAKLYRPTTQHGHTGRSEKPGVPGGAAGRVTGRAGAHADTPRRTTHQEGPPTKPYGPSGARDRCCTAFSGVPAAGM